MQLVVQLMNPSCKFGISPFAIGMTHPDAPLEAQLALQIAMRNLTDEDMKR